MNNFFYKNFANTKNNRIFAPEYLSLQPTNSALVEAAFFGSVHNFNSIDCCTLTGSRFIALLSVANDGVQQSFFINSFLISQMQPTVRNASKAKNSTLTSRATCESGKTKSTMRVVTCDSTPTVEELQGKIMYLHELLTTKTKLISLLDDRIKYLETGEQCVGLPPLLRVAE